MINTSDPDNNSGSFVNNKLSRVFKFDSVISLLLSIPLLYSLILFLFKSNPTILR